MSSIDSNFLTSKISSSSLDLSNAQKTLESAKDGLFDLSSITSGGDSFVSTTQGVSSTSSTSDTSTTSTVTQNSNMTPEQVEAAIEEYETQIAKLEQQIQEYETQIENLNTQLEAEKANLEAINQNLTTSQAELEELQAQYSAKEAEYAQINAAIEQATNEAEAEAAQKQQAAIFEAMANYNEEEDGDYNTYMQEALKGVMSDNSISTLLTGLSSQSKSLAAELGNLKMNISAKTAEVQNFQAQASTAQANITSLEGQISSVETLKATSQVELDETNSKLGTLILSQVSEEEKALAKAQGIDLTETYPNGQPKYIIAPGKSDNKFHIYQMDKCGTSGTSLARMYGANGGFDIIENGSGYINSMQDAQEGCGEATKVYNLTCVSDDLSTCKFESDCKTYCTSSPLSFDLEGDGVKTSDELIRYDIDGDGDLDTINDSADAVLVFDADGDGISGEDGSECFGDNTDLDGDGVADGYKDGFEALKALANKEGLVDGVNDNTLDVDDLKILEEKYGLQIKTDGYNSEASSLFDAGITEINLATTDETTLHKNYDGKQNDLMTQEGATFVVNGEEREYADIWHAKKDE